MKNFLLFFLVLSLLYIGCGVNFHHQYTRFPATSQGPGRNIPVYVDVQFGEADRISIENALNSWNYVLNGHIMFKPVSYKFDMEPQDIHNALEQNGLMILKINSASSLIPTVSSNERVRAFCPDGYSGRGGNMIYVVRDNIPTEELEYTMLHELGHVLGAPDVLNEPILMNSVFSMRYGTCVDKRSMELVAEYQHLDPNDLNYCVYN